LYPSNSLFNGLPGLLPTASRTILGPTQPPIQWVRGALSLGVKQPGREADYSHPPSAEVKDRVELFLRSPSMPSWRGAQLKKSTRILFNIYYICAKTKTIFIHFMTHSAVRVPRTRFSWPETWHLRRTFGFLNSWGISLL